MLHYAKIPPTNDIDLIMFIAANFLTLHPVNPQDIIDLTALAQGLNEIQFSGTQQTQQRFELGERFLSYIAFLGCSPDIELNPHPTKPYSYIELFSSAQTIRLTAGDNIKVPQCKNCKKPIDWLIDTLNESLKETTLNCQHCQHEIDILQLNWRRSAYLSRCSVSIGNIYEAEAVPNESLLIKLKEISGFEWKYSYLRHSVKP